MSDPSPTLDSRDGFVGSGLRRDSVIYGLGGLAGKAAGLVLLPVLSRALGPHDYGRYDVVGALGSSITVIFLLGLDSAATRVHADAEDDRGRAAVLSTWIITQLAVALVLAVVLFLAAPQLSDLLIGGREIEPSVRWLALVVPAGIFNMVLLNVHRLAGKPTRHALLNGGVLILNTVLAATLVGALGLGIEGAVAAWGCSLALASAVSFAVGREGLRAYWDPSIARRLLAFGLPLAPAAVAIWVAEVLNRTILLDAAGADAVGMFSVALRISSVQLLAGVAFLLAWQPRAYGRGTSPVALAQIASETLSFAYVLGAAAIAITAAAPLVVDLAAGAAFADAALLVGPLAFGMTAAATLQLISIGSTLVHRSVDLSISLVTSAVLAASLNIALAGTYGAVGTASAIALGHVAGLGVMAILARRRIIVPYDVVRFAVLGLALSTAIALVSLVEDVVARAGLAGVSIAVMGMLAFRGRKHA